MDFTVRRYTQLIRSLLRQGFLFWTVQDYLRYREESEISNPKSEIRNFTLSEAEGHKFVILRHDVDACPQKSLRLARLEHALGIRGTYYFRMVPASYDEAVIREIAALGHEVGYHYETLAQGTGHRARDTGHGVENSIR